MIESKFLLLDRDGVLNIDRVDYVKTKEELIITERTIKAVKILKAFGYRLLVITNQSCIAKGIITVEQLAYINNLINEKLGYAIDMFYYCPHYPRGDCAKIPDQWIKDLTMDCECRKPKPGLLLKAETDLRKEGLCLEHTWYVGDSYRDIEAGIDAGCKVAFLKTTPRNVLKFNGKRNNLLEKLIKSNPEMSSTIPQYDDLLDFVLEVIVK